MATRRRFIRDCSALAVSAAFTPALATAVPEPRRDLSIATLPAAELATLLGSVFMVVNSGPSGPRARVLELVGVEPRTAAGDTGASGGPGPGTWEAFSLCFRGEAGMALAQDTYSFEHARLGRFAMFIVPVDRPDARGSCYEAVFHRPAPVRNAAPSGLPLLAGAPGRSESI